MKYHTLCIAYVALTFLTSCQSTSTSSDTKEIDAPDTAIYFSQSKVDLENLENNINYGKSENLSYFAPITFTKALAEFNSAKEEYDDVIKNGASSFNVFKSESDQLKQTKKDISSSISRAKHLLILAHSSKKIIQQSFADIFEQESMLKSIKAPDIFPSDYNGLHNRIAELIELVDENNKNTAHEELAALHTDMRSLEIRTVRKTNLGQLDADIATITDKELAKDVKISFNRLMLARNNANTIISTTPRAKAEIIVAVNLANFELSHLYHLAKEVKALQNTESKLYEQYLLTKEEQLHTISESLGINDLRDLALAQQAESIALQGATIRDKLTTANSAILALQSSSSASSEAIESLREEFKSQLINLNSKYDALVIENSRLNKDNQDKDIELVRLKVYQEAVMQVESKHKAEKAQAQKEQARKDAEQKALALQQEKAKIEAEKKAFALQQELAKKEAEALAQQEQEKKEAEQLAVAQQELVETDTQEEQVIEVPEKAEIEPAPEIIPASVNEKDLEVK